MRTHDLNHTRQEAVITSEAAPGGIHARAHASAPGSDTAAKRWCMLSIASAGFVLMMGAGAAEMPRIERTDAPSLRVAEVRVLERHNGWEISGSVEKRPLGRVAQRRAGRFPIDGHLRLLAIGPQGHVLACRAIEEYAPDARRSVETFSETLAAPPGKVERIRLIYGAGPADSGSRELC